MALPPVHLILGAAAGECIRSGAIRPWHAWAVAGGVAVAPDVPAAVLLATGDAASAHGLGTHSLVGVMIAVAVTWGLAGAPWAPVVASGYASHLLVDLLRDAPTTHVYLLWPFVETPLSPLAPVYDVIPFDFHGGGMPGLYGEHPVLTLARQVGASAFVFAAVVAVSYVVRDCAAPRGRRTGGRGRPQPQSEAGD